MSDNLRLKDYREAGLKDRVVLVRMDHNVVKNGKVVDPFRIEATIPTLYNIAARGGMPVLMTHVGRPRDKKTGDIVIREGESVGAVVDYLKRRLGIEIGTIDTKDIPAGKMGPIWDLAAEAISQLRAGKTQMVYLPNIRWFPGEEAKDELRDLFARELASLGELYINDAFGSWQAHVSTYYVARHLPAYAGSLLQKEIQNLQRLFEPKRPFLAVIGGAKYDTKIGPLNALYEMADHLILGGVMYNAYLCAKYRIRIEGVPEEDISLAAGLVERDRTARKVIELGYLVENTGSDPKDLSKANTMGLERAIAKASLGPVLDVGPESFESSLLRDVVMGAKTIFINAVMGMMPYYPEGTRAFFELLAMNHTAEKFLAGGDTLQEFRSLCPGPYLQASDDPNTYFFTGGGAVLNAIENGTPFKMKILEPLMA